MSTLRGVEQGVCSGYLLGRSSCMHCHCRALCTARAKPDTRLNPGFLLLTSRSDTHVGRGRPWPSGTPRSSEHMGASKGRLATFDWRVGRLEDLGSGRVRAHAQRDHQSRATGIHLQPRRAGSPDVRLRTRPLAHRQQVTLGTRRNVRRRPDTRRQKKRATPGAPELGAPEPDQRGRNHSWPERMRRAFGFDVLACPTCGGRMRFLALILSPPAIRAILDHLGISCRQSKSAPRGPAR